MTERFQRTHQRFACEIKVLVFSRVASRAPVEAVLLDIGMGGGRLRVRGQLEPGPLLLELQLEDKPRFDARVARLIGRDPKDKELYYYGILITTHMGNVHLLRNLLEKYRGKTWEKRLNSKDGAVKRDYWDL